MTIQTSTKSLSKRILAAVLGIAVIACLLTGISLVTGNPLIQALVKNKTEKYLIATYPQYTLTIESSGKPSWGGLNSTFKAQSTLDIDVSFLVNVTADGRITDTYDRHVAGKVNTQRRLSEELAALASKSLFEILPEITVKSCTSVYGYDNSGKEYFPGIAYSDAFTLNMPLDRKTITVPIKLDLTIESEYPSKKTMSELLPKIKSAMENSALSFDYYTVILEAPNASLDVTDMQNDSRYIVTNLPSASIP